jgi:peptide-methionine (R)-S-oxide reductase
MLTRRAVFLGASGLVGIGAFGGAIAFVGARQATAAAEGVFEVVRTSAEWREMLTPEQYAVLREEGTERPYTSPLLNEHRAGTFHCAGCDNPLYASDTKYDSRTGWPSFWDALPNAVGTKEDRTLWMVRTEVHCARCGGHLGHIFEDGPQPTGLRHCINGVALVFHPAQGA